MFRNEIAHFLNCAPSRPVSTGLDREVALAAVAIADSGGDLLEHVGRNGDDLEATGSIQLFPKCVVEHANATFLLCRCRLERGVNQLKTEECERVGAGSVAPSATPPALEQGLQSKPKLSHWVSNNLQRDNQSGGGL